MNARYRPLGLFQRIRIHEIPLALHAPFPSHSAVDTHSTVAEHPVCPAGRTCSRNESLCGKKNHVWEYVFYHWVCTDPSRRMIHWHSCSRPRQAYRIRQLQQLCSENNIVEQVPFLSLMLTYRGLCRYFPCKRLGLGKPLQVRRKIRQLSEFDLNIFQSDPSPHSAHFLTVFHTGRISRARIGALWLVCNGDAWNYSDRYSDVEKHMSNFSQWSSHVLDPTGPSHTAPLTHSSVCSQPSPTANHVERG